ncbi:PadR family transcriptional regulator [Undibacterium sp. TJN19]|uniref:PadR family transcriptional regulator n=1 Tax=Undibacterium sp. TJN19 TaxID=3413055 RepID=UPI003BF01AE3
MALAHAILSSILKHPSSGYELAKEFDRVVSHFWSATHQQIYRELAGMERDGLVTAAVVEQKDRPNSKSYSITDHGRQVLAAWIAEPVGVSAMREDLLIKLRAESLVDRSVLMTEIERHRQIHLDKQEFYTSIIARDFPDVTILSSTELADYLVIRCGVRYELAYIEWCDEALTALGHT